VSDEDEDNKRIYKCVYRRREYDSGINHNTFFYCRLNESASYSATSQANKDLPVQFRHGT
jgi:hypothetical protein